MMPTVEAAMPASEFEPIGGHPVLDLVNTVAWRNVPGKETDRLVDFAAVLRWTIAAGVLDTNHTARLATADADLAERATRELARLRDLLHPVLTAAAEHRAPDGADLAAVNRMLLDALHHAEPADQLPLRWTVTVEEPGDLVHLLAVEAGELLRSPELDRLGRCADSTCGWLFVDRTRSHTRRWCSSADCGNRERARRHYARTRG